jgi:alpha-methylacyl-CoA racemase
VDAAMTDGAALLSAMFYGLKAAGAWRNERGTNLLDGGAPFYGTYECADGRHVALGALEPAFHAELLQRLGLADEPLMTAQHDRSRWPAQRQRLAARLRELPRDEWCRRLEGTDACFAPVLDWDEAPEHPHMAARETFIDVDGVRQPAPAPRFDRTPAGHPRPPVAAGADDDEVLAGWGIGADAVAALRGSGAIAARAPVSPAQVGRPL